jgi:hypothetical protein
MTGRRRDDREYFVPQELPLTSRIVIIEHSCDEEAEV